MSQLPESVQFCIDTCDCIAARGTREGTESLSPVERTIFHAYIFDSEEQNGSLSSFFYNTDSSPEIAEATASALDAIGAPKTASLLRVAASLICRPDAREFTGTWGGYLAYADPTGRLDECIAGLAATDECVADALNRFILGHRNDLKKA